MRRHAFTLIEVLVVVAIIALLISVLLPSLNHARETSKRTVCLHNTKMLGLSWQVYQVDNKGAFIGAQASPSLSTDPYYSTYPPGWVRDIGTLPAQQPVAVQNKALQDGALYKYARFLDIYHCPAIQKNEVRTYSENWGICGQRGSWNGRAAWRIDQLKQPGARMVFLDDFPEDWDAVWTITPWSFQFWNPLQARHSKGTCLGLADGHSEYWRWTDPDTLKFIAMSWADAENYSPPVMPNNRDIKRLQLASWGKLDNSGKP